MTETEYIQDLKAERVQIEGQIKIKEEQIRRRRTAIATLKGRLVLVERKIRQGARDDDTHTTSPPK